MRWRRATTASRLFSAGLCFAVVLGAAALLVRDPAWRGYPRCTMREITGLYCPGCGSLRATHALLHGRPREAASWNVLLVGLVPLLGAWMVLHAVRALSGLEMATPLRVATWVGVALAVLVLGFGLVRNLPPREANPLRPHACGREAN